LVTPLLNKTSSDGKFVVGVPPFALVASLEGPSDLNFKEQRKKNYYRPLSSVIVRYRPLSSGFRPLSRIFPKKIMRGTTRDNAGQAGTTRDALGGSSGFFPLCPVGRPWAHP
jgi:hypothetical protein